jgi:hypothetical protein
MKFEPFRRDVATVRSRTRSTYPPLEGEGEGGSDQALTPAPIGHDTPVPPSPQ